MNFIEKVQKVNALAKHLLQSGAAKDSVEAQRKAEQMLDVGSDLSEFNRDADKTVKNFQNYGEEVKKNATLRQPTEWKSEVRKKQ